MPRFAVMTFMFANWLNRGLVSHEEMLAGFAAAGVDGVEPFHTDFVRDPALLPRYRRALADSGLRTAVVDIMCNLVSGSPEQASLARECLRRGLDVAGELGADIAHVAGHRMVEGVSAADARRMIAEELAGAAEMARAAGLTLAIEDFNPSPALVCSVADCLEIMRLAGGAVKFVFDTGNFIAVCERADENFQRVADRICHCHFKDFILDSAAKTGYRSCDLGAGVIPNAQVAAMLTARGYEGWVALETYGRGDIDPVSAVKKELPVLKSWFGR